MKHATGFLIKKKMQTNKQQQQKSSHTHTCTPPLLAKIQLEKVKMTSEAKIIIAFLLLQSCTNLTTLQCNYFRLFDKVSLKKQQKNKSLGKDFQQHWREVGT